MKIRIIFRGDSVSFFETKDGKAVKLVAFIDYLGYFYYFADFKGYSRDFNKTAIWRKALT